MSPRPGSPSIGTLNQSVDFQRVLAARPRFVSSHFAIHHLAALPSRRQGLVRCGASADLSTSTPAANGQPVDDRPGAAVNAISVSDTRRPVHRLWCGAIVPKRHARRAVTRTLLKRQIRAVAFRHASSMADGLWIVRLRAPFDRTVYRSATSEVLRHAARGELEQLLIRCVAPTTAGGGTATSRPR